MAILKLSKLSRLIHLIVDSGSWFHNTEVHGKQLFSHAGTFSCLFGLNQYLAEDSESCSRTQRSVSCVSRTSDPFFLSLYTARPSCEYYQKVYFVHSGFRMKVYK